MTGLWWRQFDIVCVLVYHVAHGLQAQYQPAADCCNETPSQRQTICKDKELC